MLFGPRVRWDLTLNCNLACQHCQIGDRLDHQGNHPPLELVLAVINRLNRDTISQIGLLGGEPLSHPDIPTILESLRSIGVPVTISTNGLLLNQRLVDIMLDTLGWSVMVSIDGPDSETHEMIRGKGTFEPALAEVRRLTRLPSGQRPIVGIACTLNAITISRMAEVYDLARRLEVDLLQFGRVSPSGNAIRNFDKLGIDEDILIDGIASYIQEIGPPDRDSVPRVIIDFLDNSMKRLLAKRLGIIMGAAYTGCTAASDTAFVDSQGRLWPCMTLAYTNKRKLLEYFDFQDNSLIQRSFEEIWQSSGFNKLRALNSQRLHTTLADPCRDCQDSGLCVPCPLPYVLGNSLDQSHCAQRLQIRMRKAKTLKQIRYFSTIHER